MKKCASEFIGTFALVFAGTGAIVVNDVSRGAVTHLGVALTFGLIVLAMIYALGDVSGAHLNPAVTLGFVAAGRMPARGAPSYVASQCAGAVAASGALRLLFPTQMNLGGTAPAGSAGQSLAFEIILTAILMFVVLRVSEGSKEKGITAGIAVGAVVGLEALFAGPICGASMNPARSLGPALVSGQMASLWIYIAGPALGAPSRTGCTAFAGNRNSMKTTQFKSQLTSYPNHTLVFELPDGDRVPVQSHITEAGRVDKSFLDCGGTVRTVSTCQLQAWVDENDETHRLAPGKLAGVLDLAAPLLRGDDLEVEVEYEDCALSQYTVLDANATESELIFKLGEKHTDCLAPEFCGVSRTNREGCC